MLPSLRLRLPDDPPGLVHHTGCLLEAVLPAEWQEAEGDSLDGRHLPLTPPLQAQQAAWSSQSPHDMVVRLTVFAAGERKRGEGGGRVGGGWVEGGGTGCWPTCPAVAAGAGAGVLPAAAECQPGSAWQGSRQGAVRLLLLRAG